MDEVPVRLDVVEPAIAVLSGLFASVPVLAPFGLQMSDPAVHGSQRVHVDRLLLGFESLDARHPIEALPCEHAVDARIELDQIAARTPFARFDPPHRGDRAREQFNRHASIGLNEDLFTASAMTRARRGQDGKQQLAQTHSETPLNQTGKAARRTSAKGTSQYTTQSSFKPRTRTASRPKDLPPGRRAPKAGPQRGLSQRARFAAIRAHLGH